MAFSGLLGPTLVTKSGDQPTDQALAGKNVMLVFSIKEASTHAGEGGAENPMELYKRYYAAHSAAKKFEVVLLAGDKDKAAFDSHYAGLPWLAVPFDANRKIESRLRNRFHVQMPFVVVLFDASGKLVTTQAMDWILDKDKECAVFPVWSLKSKPFAEMIGDKFFKKGGGAASAADVAGKEVGVVFSTPAIQGTGPGQLPPGQQDPCKRFVDDLKKFLDEYRASGGQMTLVLSCPPEGDYKKMAEHFEKDLPDDCLCIPFGEKARRINLGQWFGVVSCPAIGIVNAQGVQQCSCTIAVGKIAAGAARVRQEGWSVPNLGDLAHGPGAAGVEINKSPAVVVRMEGCADGIKSGAEGVLRGLADEYVAASPDCSPEVIFCVCKTASSGDAGGKPDPSKKLSDLTKRNGGPRCSEPAPTQPLIMLFDIPDAGGFYVCDKTDVTRETIQGFIQAWRSGTATRLQLEAPPEAQQGTHGMGHAGAAGVHHQGGHGVAQPYLSPRGARAGYSGYGGR